MHQLTRASWVARRGTGAREVARVLLGIIAKAPEYEVGQVQVNGAPALLGRVGGAVVLRLQLVVTTDGVSQILFLSNPQKLAALGEVRALSAG